MKLSRLFVLSALWLMGLGVSAADLVERTAPTPADATATPVAFEVGKAYILYNVGAEMFFTQGSTWSTRGCVVPYQESAVVIRVAKYSLADAEWDGKTYEIQNYVTNRSKDSEGNLLYSWYKACMNTGGDLYLDQTSWARFYEILPQGGNVYRLMPSEQNATIPDYEVVSDGTQFVGYSGLAYDSSNDTAGFPDASERYPLSALTTDNVDWVFYDYSAFDIYEKAMELKALIEEGEKTQVDVTSAVSVYNNLNSTLAQLTAAVEALSLAISEGTFNGFTPGKALDVTKLIVNADFTGGDVSGWDGTTWGHGNSQNSVEHYNKTYNTYQELNGLRAGVFAVGMNGLYRAGNSQESYDKGKADNDDVRNASFYAIVGEETTEIPVEQIYSGIQTESRVGGEQTVTDGDVTYYQPNNSTSAEYYFHTLGLYKNVLFVNMPNEGSMTIGVKKDIEIGTDWSIFDDFSLIYCGEGAQAYQAYVEYYRDKSFPDYESMRVEAADPFTQTSGVNVSDVELNKFKGVSTSASDEASARAAMKALDNAFESVRQNVNLWAEFLNTAKKAAAVGDDASLDQAVDIVAEVGDWGKYMAADEWNAHAMSNDELRAKIDEMEAKIKEAKKHAIHEGYETVCTDLLTNPDFESGATGWTRVAASGGNVATGGTNTNTCYEAWNNANFDIYQFVKDAPEGVYRIEVQGFYRYLRGENAWNAYKAQESQYVKQGGAPVFVYMNHKATPFKNVFDEPITKEGFYSTQITTVQDEAGNNVYFPDGMISSAEAFSHGMYKQSAYGIIRAGQEMRIGVKGVSNQGGDSWVIWDNFRLFNCGKDATALNNVLPEEIAKAKAMLFEEDGVTPNLMGKEIRQALQNAITAAESALGTTGDAMFDALNDLFDAEENVDASIELFAQLKAANDKMFKAASEEYSSSPFANEAYALYEEILEALGDFKYTNSDVNGQLVKIGETMTKMRLPADYASASDLYTVDVTSIIDTPSFETDEATNSVEGWNASGYNFGNDDTQKSALALEFYNKTFDLYQIIYGVPDGYYQIGVNAFERLVEAETPAPAFLYAETAAGNFSKELMPVDEADGIGDMVSADAAFDEGKYANTLNIKVTNGKLRLGIKKETNNTNDWVIMDDFTLTYYGSSEIPLDIAGIIGDVNNDTAVDVADISCIISHMAGTTQYATADVNGDGTVDVADISKVITIMAESARLALEAIEE